ncbi:hypothetical protein Tco_0311423 [Tanacetum coccineum]
MNPPNEKCMALLLAEERFLKIKKAMEEEQNQPEVLQELLLKLINDLQILKGIQQEKKKPTAQIPPKVILIAWESFGEIKDALTDKQNRQEDIQELMSKLLEDEGIKKINRKILPIHDDDTSSDDDDFEDIEYDSLKEENEDQEEKKFDLEDILQIQDVILREKLLNVPPPRLISNIESLKVNPTPDRVLESSSPFPIPVTDSDSFLEESDTSLSHLDNSLPEFESFSDHNGRTKVALRPGGLIMHVNSDIQNDPLLELPSLRIHFILNVPSFPSSPSGTTDVEICYILCPQAPVIDNFNELNDDQRGSEIDFSQNVKDDDSFTFVIRTFLPFLTYPEVSPLSCSTGSEDTIFDPDIST